MVQYYTLTEDLVGLAWKGRWFKQQTLEHYLQEVVGQVLLAQLPQAQRDRISSLSSLAQPALHSVISS